MYRLILLFLAMVIACRQQQQPITTASPGADSLTALMKTRVNPLITDHEAGEARRLLDSIAPFVKAINQYRPTITWFFCMEGQFSVKEQYDSARYFVNQALTLAKQNDSSGKDMLFAKIKLAGNLAGQKAYDSALQYGLDGYYMAQKIDTLQLPLICYWLYDIYAGIEDIPALRKYAFEGFRRARQPFLQAYFANAVADYYERVDKPDSAIGFFKAIENDTAHADPYFTAIMYENLGVLLTEKGQAAEGLRYHVKAMAIRESGEDYNAQSYINIAATYQKLGQFDTALDYLKKAALLAREEGDLVTIKYLWQDRAANYVGLGDFQAAYRAIDSALIVYKMEVDSALVIQARELEAKYASKAKDERIRSLAMANKAGLKIRSQQRVIIIAVVVTMLSLTCAAVLFWKRRQMLVQLKETSLRLQLLSGQLEPHFIFNALGVLMSFIRSRLTEKAIGYLERFSRVLRQNLENTSHTFITVAQELKSLESYVQLQMLHFEGLFEYRISTGEFNKSQICIPPMMLQPFAENAILHGFKSIGYKGLLTIHVVKHGHVLRCVIEDNGSGLEIKDHGPGRPHSTGITLERLALLERQTGRPGRLTITDKRTDNGGQGVLVVLDIPFS